MKNYIYMTICCINNCNFIVNFIYNYLKKSKLFDIIDEIRCVIINSKNIEIINNFIKLPKIKVIYKEFDNIGNYSEYITLNLLLEHSKLENFNVLYIHSKGVSDRHQDTNSFKNILSWIKYLLYFNIDKYEIVLHNLQFYDSIGVNLNGNNTNIFTNNYNSISKLINNEGWCGPSWPYHFSGNFWWSKSNYIKNLNNCLKEYPASEFWITTGKTGKFLCLWNAEHNFYESEYNSDIYINQDLKLYTRINKNFIKNRKNNKNSTNDVNKLVILYGTNNIKIDVTNIVFSEFKNDNIYKIPGDDSIRAYYFTDPKFGEIKSIFINDIEYKGEVIINYDTNEIYENI